MSDEVNTSRIGFRRAHWFVAAVALGVLIFSGWRLGVRIADYNERNTHPIFYFMPAGERDLMYSGMRVGLRDELDADGRGEVIVSYGSGELRLPVEIPTELALPGMARHNDWLRLLIFAEGTGMSYRAFLAGVDAGEIATRMVVVTRRPMADDSEPGNFGVEAPKTWGWGEVLRHRWAFTFYELMPDGGFASQTLRYPESGTSYYRRQVKAERAGEPMPVRADDELTPHTWQHAAALRMMPRTPAITKEDQPLRGAGWTLPAAMASGVVAAFAIALAVAPAKRRD